MKTLSTLLFALAVAVPVAAQTPAASPAADVVGTWDVTVNTQQGAIPSQIKLKKDGAKLVGTIASQMGESNIEAEVKEKALAIWFNMQGQNGPMAIEMNGTVDGDKAKRPAKGFIGLQLHTGPPMRAEFRNMSIRTLD